MLSLHASVIASTILFRIGIFEEQMRFGEALILMNELGVAVQSFV